MLCSSDLLQGLRRIPTISCTNQPCDFHTPFAQVSTETCTKPRVTTHPAQTSLVNYTPCSRRIIPMQWIRAGFHGNMLKPALRFTYPVHAGSHRSKACQSKSFRIRSFRAGFHGNPHKRSEQGRVTRSTRAGRTY